MTDPAPEITVPLRTDHLTNDPNFTPHFNKAAYLLNRLSPLNVINARDPRFGVAADNVTDDAAGLNAAAAAAVTAGGDTRLVVPRGVYRINSTVTFTCSVDADQATFIYAGTGDAVILGTMASGSAIQRRTYRAPMVQKLSSAWDGTSRGVVAANLNSCQVYVPYARSFETGFLVTGYGTGNVYNNYFLGQLLYNHKQLTVSGGSAGGWANQNQFIGGRIECPVSVMGTVDDTSASAIALDSPAGGSMPDGNTFIGTSVENVIPAYYRLAVNGTFNKFINCRWENNGGSSRVRWGPNAHNNTIDGGYDYDQLVPTVITGASNNLIRL